MKSINDIINESAASWKIYNYVDDYKGIKLKWNNDISYIYVCPKDKTIVPFTDDEIEELDDDIIKKLQKLKFGESCIIEDENFVIYTKVK